MAGSLSQIDLTTGAGTIPETFIQLRFPAGESVDGTLRFYAAAEDGRVVLVDDPNISLAGLTPDFTVDGFDYYSVPVPDLDWITSLTSDSAVVMQNLAVVYLDGTGDVVQVFGLGNSAATFEFDEDVADPADAEIPALFGQRYDLIDRGIVAGDGTMYGMGPFQIDVSGQVGFGESDPNSVCFGAGTMIATPEGARVVEMLAPGDLIHTADGRAVPVLWIGRQSISALFAPADRACPVCIGKGALGEGLPVADLTLTQGHALLLDGVLVNAAALVNGTTITRVPRQRLAPVTTYWHIETENHEVILANGVAAETFVDNVTRRLFDNYTEFEALFGAGRDEMAELPMPRAVTPRQVPRALKARLAALSGVMKTA